MLMAVVGTTILLGSMAPAMAEWRHEGGWHGRDEHGGWNRGWHGGWHGYYGPRVFIAPPPVYVPPPRVYYAPPPVVYAPPPPVYYSPY
jgi:hypothetical protein